MALSYYQETDWQLYDIKTSSIDETFPLQDCSSSSAQLVSLGKTTDFSFNTFLFSVYCDDLRLFISRFPLFSDVACALWLQVVFKFLIFKWFSEKMPRQTVFIHHKRKKDFCYHESEERQPKLQIKYHKYLELILYWALVVSPTPLNWSLWLIADYYSVEMAVAYVVQVRAILLIDIRFRSVESRKLGNLPCHFFYYQVNGLTSVML